MTKEVGGFFGLELGGLGEYHEHARRFNTGRNCLRVLIRAKKYSKIYIPYYICDAVIKAIETENTEYEFYRINQKLEPIESKTLKMNEAFLYVNYFGLKDKTVKYLSSIYKDNLIVDNSQAFFAKPLKDINTFYSPRKFFGVPDGGYVYSNSSLPEEYKTGVSYFRFEHLLKRIDINAESSFELFQENEKSLDKQSIKKMSNITKKLLQNIDYKNVKFLRERNFNHLHKNLKDKNEFDFEFKEINGSLVYPFLVKNKDLRNKLIDKKIYVPLFWDNVLEYSDSSMFEYYISKNLIPLPVDQRYNEKDMTYILSILEKFIT